MKRKMPRPAPGTRLSTTRGVPSRAVAASTGNSTMSSFPRSFTIRKRLSGDIIAECGCGPVLPRRHRPMMPKALRHESPPAPPAPKASPSRFDPEARNAAAAVVRHVRRLPVRIHREVARPSPARRGPARSSATQPSRHPADSCVTVDVLAALVCRIHTRLPVTPASTRQVRRPHALRSQYRRGKLSRRRIKASPGKCPARPVASYPYQKKPAPEPRLGRRLGLSAEERAIEACTSSHRGGVSEREVDAG